MPKQPEKFDKEKNEKFKNNNFNSIGEVIGGKTSLVKAIKEVLDNNKKKGK